MEPLRLRNPSLLTTTIQKHIVAHVLANSFKKLVVTGKGLRTVLVNLLGCATYSTSTEHRAGNLNAYLVWPTD